jgi:hypothetical protein
MKQNGKRLTSWNIADHKLSKKDNLLPIRASEGFKDLI